MFEALKNFVTNPRKSLLEKRANLELKKQERKTAGDQERARLENDPDYQILLRARCKEKEIEEHDRVLSLELAHIEIQLSQVKAELHTSSAEITEKIHQLWNDITFTQKQKSINGTVEKTGGMYGPAKGYLETNAKKIDGRVTAIRHAIAQLEALKLLPVDDDLHGEIQKITAAIPPLDISTEKIECTPGIANGLQYPQPERTIA